jgi:hypothetical protein
MLIQHLFSLIHCIEVYKMISMLAGLTVCSDLKTKLWIQVTHKRHPRHTSLLKVAAQKQTQFAANNTELDLASHESYSPENGKKLHKLCISINLSILSLAVLHNWQRNCWFSKKPDHHKMTTYKEFSSVPNMLPMQEKRCSCHA